MSHIYQLITARQRFADIAKGCAKNSSKASMSAAEAIGYERACADIEMLILEAPALAPADGGKS
jgi:hypothetical protein